MTTTDMSTTKLTMRAIQQDVLGGPEVLHEVEVPRPKPGISEILVRVHAASVNPTDWKHRATGRFLGDPPFILGWDLAGVVEEVGLGVTLFKPGDAVMGMLPYPARGRGARRICCWANARLRAQAGKRRFCAGRCDSASGADGMAGVGGYR